MTDNMRFLIDRARFTGNCVSTVTPDGLVHYSGALYNKGGPNLSVADYIAHPEAGARLVGPVVIDGDEMADLVIQWEKDTYLNRPAVRISQPDYWEALEVLPPMKWETVDGIERFMMSEFTTGSITTQYAKMGNRCVCKHVDAIYPETFITADDFESAVERRV